MAPYAPLATPMCRVITRLNRYISAALGRPRDQTSPGFICEARPAGYTHGKVA